ncbi:MAG: VOC family protein [Verrucomicrobia bacterium]|nr:VOC family protein [Verrucomicrobiota bacterium]
MTSTLQLHAVSLRVADLARSLKFYVGQLGFVAVESTPTSAALATSPGGPALLTLIEDRSAQPAPREAAGLFHAALLLPGHAALGAWLRHAVNAGVSFDGFSDHGVSEALYFHDPEGNGLEFYADRPRDAWPFDQAGQLAMGSDPIDLEKLLADAAPANASPLAGARWGHLHLRVTSLDRSDAYYRRTLGLTLMQDSFAGARFLAADGYHHHLGLNIWGRPRQAQPANALGLAEATFARTGPAGDERFTDPDGIHVRLLASPSLP